MSKPKKAKPSEDATTPGMVMAAKIRARANKLTDSDRGALIGDAMRIIYGSEGNRLVLIAADTIYQRLRTARKACAFPILRPLRGR